MNQPDLFDNQDTDTLTAQDRVSLAWLEEFLLARADWATAHAITQSSDGLLTDRATRALASASGWIISGQRGYKHIRCSTPEEIQHAAAWLESQSKKMGDRARTYRRNAHKLVG